jgi:hypothetical protein
MINGLRGRATHDGSRLFRLEYWDEDAGEVGSGEGEDVGAGENVWMNVGDDFAVLLELPILLVSDRLKAGIR